MRIDTIHLRNFRCFEDRAFELAPRFNLLVGDNGSGKTSILGGLAVGLGALLLGFPTPAKPRGIHRDEVRLQFIVHGEVPTAEPQSPSAVECQGAVAGQPCRWRRELNTPEGRTNRQHAEEIVTIAERLREAVQQGQPVILPLISYYGTGRLWVQIKQREVGTLSPDTRFMGYLDCLNPASDQKRLLEWFKTNEFVAIQRGAPLGVLEAARRAILDCVADATHVWFDVSRDQLMLRFPDRELPFDYLSDGYRDVLAIAADMAVRCATLNPAQGENAARETPGVVLIDEMDLHLHPNWQRRVVPDLLRAFPHVQFVGTTHSPFIIQSLLPDERVKLVNLTNERATDYINKSVEVITEEVQGVEVPQRSRRYLEMIAVAQRYYQVLRQAPQAAPEQVRQLKEELDRLALPFSDDPAYQAFLRLERTAAGIDGGGNHAAS